MDHERPPVTVVIPTTGPWPDVEHALRSVVPQARVSGAQVLVLDGSPDSDALPDNEDVREITVIAKPGASVFELRALGVEQADGEVIAITEDHCAVAPNWCARVSELHREHTDIGVIGGAVVNGSTRRLGDWANFLLTFSTLMPPLRIELCRRPPSASNFSIKRSEIENIEFPLGKLEGQFLNSAYQLGNTLIDPDLQVRHIQSHGWRVFEIHFHNGRTTGGLTRPRPERAAERLRVIRHAVSLPYHLTRQVIYVLRHQKIGSRRAVASIPIVFALACCHAAGEIVGTLFGPGSSPMKLQ